MFKVGILLKRNPQIMKLPSKFTQAYLNFKQQQPSRPFYKEFYYKKGSLQEQRFLEQQKSDEVVQPVEPELEEFLASIGHKPDSTGTEEANPNDANLQSLDRKLSDNLYLLLKNGNNYEFPTSDIKDKEFLLDASNRELKSLSSKLEFQVVGRVPIAHTEDEKLTTFYMKSYIIAGKIERDHLWLTKDEIKSRNPQLFDELQDVLD